MQFAARLDDAEALLSGIRVEGDFPDAVIALAIQARITRRYAQGVTALQPVIGNGKLTACRPAFTVACWEAYDGKRAMQRPRGRI